MNKVYFTFLLAAALGLSTSNAFAWTSIGDVIILDDEVFGATIASSSNHEVYGMRAEVYGPGSPDSDSCVALPPNYDVICGAESHVASPTPGSGYCGAGAGMPLKVGG